MDDPMQSMIDALRRERMPKSIIPATRRCIRSESSKAPRTYWGRFANATLGALAILIISLIVTSQKHESPKVPEAQKHVRAFVDTIQSLNVVSEALVNAGQKSSEILVSEAVIPWKNRLESAKEKLNQAISKI